MIKVCQQIVTFINKRKYIEVLHVIWMKSASWEDKGDWKAEDCCIKLAESNLKVNILKRWLILCKQ